MTVCKPYVNQIRVQVNDYCRKHRICTSCYGRRAKAKCSMCATCHERKRKQKIRAKICNPTADHDYYVKHAEAMKSKAATRRNRIKLEEAYAKTPIQGRPLGSHKGRKIGSKNKKHKPKLTNQQTRANHKEYKKKALYNKVRKLDRIRYAVEKGREL